MKCIVVWICSNIRYSDKVGYNIDAIFLSPVVVGFKISVSKVELFMFCMSSCGDSQLAVP
jgi:hypothetical protein